MDTMYDVMSHRLADVPNTQVPYGECTIIRINKLDFSDWELILHLLAVVFEVQFIIDLA